MKNMKLLLLLFSLLVLVQILGSKGCFKAERTALLNIKASFVTYPDNYPGAINESLSSWVHDPNSDCCMWSRVKCNPFSGHVTKLHLQELEQDAALLLEIDLSLFQTFKELRSLNLSDGRYGLNHSEGLCALKKIRVLDLSYNDFIGPMPKCFNNLTSLQVLDLSMTSIGEIETSVIAGLPSLEYLSLLDNNLEGVFTLSSFANNSHLKVLAIDSYYNRLQVDTEGEGGVSWMPSFQLKFLYIRSCKLNAPRANLPSFLSNQHELLYLDLSDNNLIGKFPNWLLVNNTELKSLILHNNSFNGSFELPTNMDKLHRPLYCLGLAYNKLQGKLPENIGHVFPSLEYLNLSGNGFYGTIPASIGNMSKLSIMDLSNNKFYGEVPETLWIGCASLEYLILSNNILWGHLFPLPLNMSYLKLLFMDNNSFNRTLERAILHLPTLYVMDVSNNKLWGKVPGSIGNLSNLQTINLSGNNFTGALPKELCKLDLDHVHLSDNNLSGSIPACYLKLPHLVTLHLRRNNLVGSIPRLSNTSNWLTSLDLRDNYLSGTIPDWIGKGVNHLLRALLLGGNNLQGQIPDSLCRLKVTNFLDLSRNNFFGTIPACLMSNLPIDAEGDYMAEYIEIVFPKDSWYQYHHRPLLLHLKKDYYSISALSRGIEVDFRTKGSFLLYKGYILGFMSGIDLSCNQLTGSIPQEIGYLASLHALNLSHNRLNGSIPESFHSLKNLESLDLSHNDLSGTIPSQLQDLNSLGFFNVSYNNLSGTVPNKGHLANFDESSFIGNQNLFWNDSNRGTTTPLSPLATTPSKDGHDDDSVIDITVFYWSFVATYVTVLLLFITILWINPHWRKAWFYFIKTCLLKCSHLYFANKLLAK